MSVFHENMLIGSSGQGGAAGPTAGRSIRLNSADSARLTRSFSSGNRRTWTLSCWVKRSKLDGSNPAFTILSRVNGSAYVNIGFASDKLKFTDYDGSNTVVTRITEAVYRDVSSWYHVVVVLDTTNGTEDDRARIYVNGSRVTAFSSSNNVTSSAQGQLNLSGTHEIGRDTVDNIYSDGYLALVHFIDGQALTPSSFGETSATTGQWIAKDYSGSYGTNGFFLDFADNSSAAALGYDAAGSNDWTVNNLSVTAGSGNDSLRDHPTSAGTDTGVGGEISGNYCTFNPLDTSLLAATLLNGNLDYSSAAVDQGALGTFGLSSGKWYWEVVTTAGTTQTRAGLRKIGVDDYYFSLSANNTVYGIRFNADAGTLDYTSNGSTWTSIATGLTSGPYFPYFENRGSTSKTVSANFGQRAFSYTAPTNYKVVCDTNLSPTIAKPNTVMDALLWTGNGSARSITGLGFNPDLVWIKGRSGATDHALYDAVRGTEKRLESNNTDAEVTSDGGVTAFNSDGFSLGTLAQVNTNSATYVGWTWDAGSSNATNTSGTITSTVRANISAGFSVVSYTGTAANATVGHGLGVAPSFMVVKNRDFADVWMVYHSSLGATKYIILNRTDAAGTLSSVWNNTAPTSSVFSIGSLDDVNRSSNKFIAYCWAPVNSYSSFGQYTGNGSSDGPFVYTGFRPRWVMVKRTDSATSANWTIVDTARDTYNVVISRLFANLSDAEITNDNPVDILSNGFKLRTTSGNINASGGTFIYACFAESPLPYARAR